jgi:hypothetical protein
LLGAVNRNVLVESASAFDLRVNSLAKLFRVHRKRAPSAHTRTETEPAGSMPCELLCEQHVAKICVQELLDLPESADG